MCVPEIPISVGFNSHGGTPSSPSFNRIFHETFTIQLLGILRLGPPSSHWQHHDTPRRIYSCSHSQCPFIDIYRFKEVFPWSSHSQYPLIFLGPVFPWIFPSFSTINPQCSDQAYCPGEFSFTGTSQQFAEPPTHPARIGKTIWKYGWSIEEKGFVMGFNGDIMGFNRVFWDYNEDMLLDNDVYQLNET